MQLVERWIDTGFTPGPPCEPSTSSLRRLLLGEAREETQLDQIRNRLVVAGNSAPNGGSALGPKDRQQIVRMLIDRVEIAIAGTAEQAKITPNRAGDSPTGIG